MKQVVGFILLVLLMPNALFAESIQAVVDRNRTDLESPVLLTVSLPGRDGSVDTSVIKDFSVQSRGSSTRVEIVNGRMRQEKIQEFLLVPKRSGNLTIPALPVAVDGKTYQTAPIGIEVLNASSDKAVDGQDIVVLSEVSEREPYIGQQFIYTFRLRYAVQLANIQYSPPEFTGLTSKQIGDQQTRQRVIDGRRFQEIELSYLLIPIKDGPLTIGPAELRCETVSRGSSSGPGRDRMFGDPFFSNPFFDNGQLRPRVLRTKSVALTVRPLPKDTGSVSFSGLVGRFTMVAGIEANQIKVGDSVTLSVTIEGTGNIMDADAPLIEVPKAFKQYADSPQSDIKLGSGGYEGKKIFRLALVAVSQGHYQVALAGLTYFDPKDSSYHPLSTPPVSIDVRQAEGNSENLSEPSSAAENEPLPEIRKRKVDFTGRDILPLKGDLAAIRNYPGLSIPLIVFGLLLPAALFVIVQIGLKLRHKTGSPASIMAQKALGELKMSNLVKGEGEDFFSHLHRAILYAVCSKGKTCSESLTDDEVRQIMAAAKATPEQINKINELMREIGLARFGGKYADAQFREDLAHETTRLVKEVLR
jgi:hypothetical protein